jgi:uncharacterized membrane-anchored protein YitT (DUF2179 family)
MGPVFRQLVNVSLILSGILSAGMGLKGFLLPSHFIDGGVTGASMLLAYVLPLPLSFWLPVVNAPFVLIAYWRLGPAFALRGVLAIGGLALTLHFFPYPKVTSDRFLTAIFGGFFTGAGIGLTIRGGAVLDGTEIAALLISRRTHFLRLGDVILGFNVLIFLTAMIFLGVEPVLYSILSYLAAAKTLDFVLYGLEEFTAITIITTEGSMIRREIIAGLGRGATIWRAYGGKTGREREILYCVVTRLEIGRVKEIAQAADEHVFVTIHPLATVFGGTLKRNRHL